MKILRQKAAERNPDEFYFGMMSSKTHKGGQKIADRGNKALSTDAVKLLKTQDAGYLKTMAQKTRKARERLEQEFSLGQGHGIEVLKKSLNPGSREHIVFVESKTAQKKYSINGLKGPLKQELDREPTGKRIRMDAALGSEEEDCEANIANASKQKSSKQATEAQQVALRADRALRRQYRRGQEARRNRLEALKSREKDILAAEQELELQRARMNNSIGGINKAGIKWKVRERKR